jgi:hypothetical protein
MMCGYSNCFRDAVQKRGFLNVCAVHAKDPKKRPDNGSIWRRIQDSAARCTEAACLGGQACTWCEPSAHAQGFHSERCRDKDRVPSEPGAAQGVPVQVEMAPGGKP